MMITNEALTLSDIPSTAASWPDILAASLNNQPTAKYTVQPDFQELAANEGNLTTKTAISPAALRGPIISPNDPSRGAEQAVVDIVYFSDFACSFCRQQETIIKQALEQYPNQVRVIWKDLPEVNPSSQSYQAAKAGRCAFQQNKFWLFHDQLLSLKSFDI